MSGTRRCTDVYVDSHTCRTDEKKSDKPCSQVKKGAISGDVFFFRTDNGKYLGSTTVGTSTEVTNISFTLKK